jgi:hypothetical protein
MKTEGNRRWTPIIRVHLRASAVTVLSSQSSALPEEGHEVRWVQG